jgi:hypothetical protein
MDVFLQDLPIGLLDDIYGFASKFSQRLDEVSRHSFTVRHATFFYIFGPVKNFFL